MGTMKTDVTRREFLESTGARLTAGGLVAAGFSETSTGYAANETITVGCLGTGGRCRRLMQALQQIAGVRIVSVCDVWDVHRQKAQELAGPKASAHLEFREVLDRSDIDAILIASPDHWHVPMTIAACEAGKDVYVEKPLTHDLSEGPAVLEAEKRTGRIVQVGMQQRSMPQCARGKQLVAEGGIGKVHKVHLTWNRNRPRGTDPTDKRYKIDPKTVDWKRFLGNAPDQPFDPFRFREWRWFWDFGGGILTDLMVHQLDIANWLLGLEGPAQAVTIGDHFQTEGVWETPDTIQTLMQYPDKEVQVYFEGTFVSARNRAMIELMGRDATLYLDRGRLELYPEHGGVEPIEMILGEGPKGADFYANPDGELLHLTNWVECMRSRKTPVAPVSAGVEAVLGPHLGNLAYRQQEVARMEEARS